MVVFHQLDARGSGSQPHIPQTEEMLRKSGTYMARTACDKTDVLFGDSLEVSTLFCPGAGSAAYCREQND